MDRALYEEMFALEQQHWWFAAKRQIVVSLLNAFAEVTPSADAPAVVCDIGCGCGMQAAELSEAGWNVIGVDASEDALTYCRARGVDAVQGRLPDDVPLEPGSLDAVLMLDVLEHVDDDAGSLAAGAERLKPGGVLICTVPAYAWMWTDRDDYHHHKRRYSRRAFAELIRSCDLCEVMMTSFMNTVLFPLALASRLGSKLVGSSANGGDLSIPPLGTNALFRAAFAAERHLLSRGVGMPYGLSQVAVLRRKPVAEIGG